MVPQATSAKVRVKALIDEADAGDIGARTRCATAYRIHVARAAIGSRDDMSEEAEAGEAIDALDAANARNHQRNVEAMIKALAGAR